MNTSVCQITTKDCGSFNEQLTRIFIMAKKIEDYKESITDQDIKMTFERIYQMLKTHHEKLIEAFNAEL